MDNKVRSDMRSVFCNAGNAELSCTSYFPENDKILSIICRKRQNKNTNFLNSILSLTTGTSRKSPFSYRRDDMQTIPSFLQS